MKEFISAYVKEIDKLYQTGLTTEHSFRPALQRLLQDCTRCTVINEQTHIDCGAPDLTIVNNDKLPVAYIEAKDLEDGDLDGRKKNKEQFDRYKASLDTVIFTDYLDFHLYEHGEWQQSVRLAEVLGDRIRLSDTERFISLMEHVKNAVPQRITSAGKLAQLMAGKARLLRDIIEQALIQDGDNQTDLRGYMEAFRTVLIHDITPKQFADIYAQTIAYGMFAARLHDDTPEDFTRNEAANLIPKSNPFLRKVFQQIAGFDLDERIAWIVDDLVCAFAATDMEKVMQGFGKSTGQTDPILHFYEDFLYQYDPAAKKQCGVYYTPQPVVSFIVRAVDDILRQEFALPMGLADTGMVEVEREIEQDLKHRKEKVRIHRVQLLDPATGTGTFLAEAVRQIKRNLAGQMGAWRQYVPEHLLPRLYGFELMMAPYTIAHLKLDMEIGIPSQQRLRIYLTNSLEESNPDTGTLFGNYLAQEANAASAVKRDTPVMIVMGNPPYSVSSNNKGEWINRLLDDYKKNLNERNIQPLSDDYIKFIRLAQHYIERNGEGIMAYISNNSFLDGLIHRQMRQELMRVFDKIYILDLHGNSRKKETAPDGSKDENVFDIMQGVSINIFVKSGTQAKNSTAQRAGRGQGSGVKLFHFDLYGTREKKYEYLRTHSLHDVEWQQLEPQAPSFFFVNKDFSQQEEYEKGFKVNELMLLYNSGVQTENDGELISFEAYKTPYNKDYSYRPFDYRYINFDIPKIGRPRLNVMKHMLQPNIALIAKRGFYNESAACGFITDKLFDRRGWTNPGMQGAESVFPLYLYPEEGSIETERRVNMDAEIMERIMLGTRSTSPAPKQGEEVNLRAGTTALQIFEYIYGVLHSPAYRAKYKEFLKVDFPRIPYPKNAEEFEHFRYYGEKLAALHLMHNIPESSVEFPEAGTMQVEKVEFSSFAPESDSGKVYINAAQYFDHVPREAWEMFIGGYQPAQKWLQTRKGRTLSYDDIQHYRRIIAVLKETSRLMREIDK